jgi:beta-aspartyl-peptidase (threonine type)
VPPSVIVHGGAGNVAPERRAKHVAGCERAVAAALEVLQAGGRALDAAQRAVEVLEDDPLFNAGRGSCLNEDGGVELDAALMDGDGLRYGAVCAMPSVRHPIAVARAVMEEGRHAIYAGEGALRFAEARGFARVPDAELITEQARERWEAVRAGRAEAGWSGGTVGAVAFDGTHVAAATSTGGMVDKRRGRVGDSPLPGAGTYADDLAGGVSATGNGEKILRVGVGFLVVAALRGGADPMAAAEQAIATLAARVDGTGGVIALDCAGRPGRANNTETMTWAWGSTDGARESGW